ncbi:MAG: hypothetical protein ACLFQA_00145 [Bacteroidales bacterium]
MSDKKRHIDDIFGEELRDHKVIPPEGLWNKIDTQLAKKRKSRTLVYLSRIAAAVAMLLGFGGGLMYVLRQDNLRDNYLVPESMVIIPAPERETVNTPVEPLSQKTNQVNLNRLNAQESDHNLQEAPKAKQVASKPGLASNTTTVTERDIIYRNLPVRPVHSLQLENTDREAAVNGLLAFNKETLSSANTQKVLPEPKSRSGKRWQAGIMIAPNYSHRTLSEGNTRSLGKSWYNNIESGLLSFSGRITVSYQITDKFSLQSGLDILNMGQSITGIQVFDDPSSIEVLRTSEKKGIAGTNQSVQNSLGQILTTSTVFYITDNHRRMLNDFTSSQQNAAELDKELENGKLLQELFYLQVPFVLQYKMLYGNTGFVLSGGMGTNFLSGNRIILEHQGESVNIGKTLDITSFSLSGIMGIGLEQKINETLFLSLEPRFSYFVTPVNPNMNHRAHPYSLSLYGGISFRF